MYTRTGATDPRPDVDWIRRRAERTWTQGWTHGGISPPPARRDHARRTASRSSRRSRLPVAIVHGDADPIFSVVAAQELAAAIPGARLTIVPGMGHDLPPAFWPVVLDAVGRPTLAQRSHDSSHPASRLLAPRGCSVGATSAESSRVRSRRGTCRVFFHTQRPARAPPTNARHPCPWQRRGRRDVSGRPERDATPKIGDPSCADRRTRARGGVCGS